MDVADVLKELRLMKGQAGYRFCLQWFVVVLHDYKRPLFLAFVLWMCVAYGADIRVGNALVQIVPWIARMIGK